ncbi:molybdopterin oxidoreductase [Desulfitobacterium hafniense DCB-2]|uniref:Molybdopterin oxidoreductase, acetylene hydratase-like n=2 Tax=Desulfitobacterium hafniense TaxID=49338 RepID=A0A098B763_DESHA|nr:molybdopterin-dependent oxidoreductase [Desulfitobacterium hafniense]ACL19948.1 molybdopterin oxidoreductase [Desulfitobacterium hafniense DCB-2]CDX03696.1 Molybdopterin oxidoreductase, acetylene hydratase-like [Desulfitobacterium hafniense]
MKYQKPPTNNEVYMRNENVYGKRVKTWKEDGYTVVRDQQFTAPGCHNSCGILYYLKDGKVAKVEGDHTHPFNRGKTCMRCLNLPEIMYHPERLKYPMKRVGERGENKWERISWDEAYALVKEKSSQYTKEFGAESIATINGTGRNICIQSSALNYGGFHSPNISLAFLSGSCCYIPRMLAAAKACGARTIIDTAAQHPVGYEHPEFEVPEVIVNWAKNGLACNADGTLGHWIVDLMKQGTKLIVIDPSLTWLASRADVWLRIRPGTDTALALGMANIIIQEGLYDKEFCDLWSYGFEEFAARCAEYPVEKVADICWCPKEKIIEAARLYGKAKPASIEWGLPLDQCKNGMAASHAVHHLRALTGNLDVPGGDLLIRHTNALDSQMNSLIEYVPKEDLENKRLGANVSPFTVGHQGATAQPDAILRAIETGDPYAIKMIVLFGTNPISNMAAEAPRVREALKKVDFVMSLDYYMTPTNIACADLVLPIAMSAERNAASHNFVPLKIESKFTQYYDAKSDDQITAELGHVLDPEGGFKNIKTDIDFVNAYLRQWAEPSEGDLTFDDVVNGPNLGYVYDDWNATYYKYKKGLLRADGQPGFNTPTGRYEFYVTAYAAWGKFDPLPAHEEPPESPYSTPQLFEQYPLIFTAGHRSYEFFHSEGRNQPTMREFHPWPLCELHPDTAAKYGLAEGDWVWMENQRGKCKQKLKLNPSLDLRQCRAEHGWWYPERAGAEPSLYGTFDSNPNNLIPQYQFGPTAYGAPYKTQLCKVYKVTPENDENLTERLIKTGGFSYVREY